MFGNFVTLLAAAALATVWAGVTAAGPNGATVVGGSATIQGAGTSSVTVNQSSQNAIINWSTFNIGTGETTTFNQPNSSAVALNRVIGGFGPSLINGTLTASGRVFIVNGDGILFGSGAVINTAGFLATTNDIRNADFMAGNYDFSIHGNPSASIVNLGHITATSGGFAALVAPGVRNSGTITATLGTVALAAGNAFTLDFYGDKLITLAVNDQIASTVIDVATGQPLTSLVSNTGQLKANGGTVQLTASAARAVVDSVINNSGVIEANSIGTHNGMILLGAATGASKPVGAPVQTVKLAGKISAAGKKAGTTGGTVVVTGENIVLAGANINASGQNGGGTVLIGGDTSGGHPSALAASIVGAGLEPFAVPTATTVSVDGASAINASATGQGNGGKVVVWSDQETTFAGTIFAKGGAAGGNGGFVETSGHQQLNFTGVVDLRAPLGATGTLLLDPADFYVDPNSGGPVVPAGASVMTEGQVEAQLALGNLTITTSTATNPIGQNGDIFVYSNINWSTNSTLTLSAYRNIGIEPGATISNYATNEDGPLPTGSLVLRADNTGTGIGSVNFLTADESSGAVNFSGSAGAVSIFYNPADNPAGGGVNGSSYTSPTIYSSYVGTNANLPNQLTAYMLVNTVYDLQNVQNNLNGNYALGRNIDASATAGWNDGAGFVPIGSVNSNFTGTFNGQGNTISNLMINLPSSSYVGLFGELGSSGLVENVGIVGGSVSGSFEVGGLIGGIFGTVKDAYASDAVTGDSVVGGLIGGSSGSVIQSYATGTVTGTNGSNLVGGLIGANGGGTVTQSYAMGRVTGGTGSSNLGGLIGGNGGTVTSSYWDTQTSGQTVSDGGTGLTTAQLQAGLPSGFDATVWGSNSSINNGYPFLLWQTPSGSLVVDGYVFSNAGLTAVGNGITVFGLVNGTSVGTVTTGADGSYNFILTSGTISTSGSQVLTYTTGADGGAAYLQDATGSVHNLNIYEGYLNETSGAGTLSAVSAGLSIAVGANAGVQTLVNGLANRAINATAASFTIDQPINAGTLLLSSTGAVTQSAPITATSLALLGSGGSYTLTNSGNQVGTLAADTGSVSLADSTNLSVGTVVGTAGVTASGTLTLNVNGTITAPGAVDVGAFTLGGGNWLQVSAKLPSFTAQDFSITGGSFLRALGGDGSTESPYEITDLYGLQGIASAGLLNQNFVLANNIDASGTANWNNGAGFVPIGSGPTNFTGAFNGQGNTISNLTIYLPSSTEVGLFGDVGAGGTVQNVGLIGGSVTGENNAGALVGVNLGTVTQSYATGAVSGGIGFVGGLVGYNIGSVSQSYATGAVSFATGAVDAFSGGELGGLVGGNMGAVTQSYATGAVSVSGSLAEVGGLVAWNIGSVTQSYATGAVTGGTATGGLVGVNYGSVTQSYATGAVTGGTATGGLVGANYGSVAQSYATGAVTTAELVSYSGGLVGYGAPGSTITDSQAFGNVIASANGTPQSEAENGPSSFVGGLVGQNLGSIGGSVTPTLSSTCVQGASYSCAAGAVSVGSLGQAGGLVGDNYGTITNAFATGAATGAAGSPSGQLGNANTYLGGLVGANLGVITNAFATGAVGSAGVAYLTAGGLVGQNSGTINFAVATGNVSAGDNSQAGGLSGGNSPENNSGCGGGCPVGASNLGSIGSSSATGNVLVGVASLAGGFSGTADGTFSADAASGNVTGGANSVLGGFLGGMGVGEGPSLISLSFASGAVTGTGPNSIIGGFIGANGGQISSSSASGPVTGTSDSFLGGLAGVNIGAIQNSSATGLVTGTGSNNVAGGLVGANFGSIDPSTSSGNVASGPNSVVGGLVGANGAFSNFPAGVVGYSFPVGTVSSDSIATGTPSGGSGSTVGPQIGENYPTSGLPNFPSLVSSPSCNNALCTILATGLLTDPNPNNSTPIPSPNQPNGQPQNQPTTQAQLIQDLFRDFTLASLTLGDVVNTQALNQLPQQPPGGVGQNRLSPGPTGPGGLPPQFGNRFFTPPPVGETRFIKDEVVLQIPTNIPAQQLQAVLSRLGLTVLNTQSLGLLGVNTYRVRIGNGGTINSVIQALAAYQIVAGAQANYVYSLVQDNGAPAPELAQDPDLAGREQEGDAAQYALGKLGLIEIHRALKGANVPIAVIDSEIDVDHPDLKGAIVEQFDAVGTEDKPHSHGTGMAGAIAAHRRLMGIAPSSKLYAIHAFSSGAATSESTTFSILKGIDWATAKGARVINMSFAGPRDPSMERELKVAHDKGIVLIAAAGNAGPKAPPQYPGADPNVIAVTATDINDKIFSGANRGRYIAVAAPGVDVLVPAPDATYQLTTGTSVASAEVSGIAALMLERNPDLKPEDVRRILTASARHPAGKDRDDDFGSGLVDPSKAIQTAGELSLPNIATGSISPRSGAEQKRTR